MAVETSNQPVPPAHYQLKNDPQGLYQPMVVARKWELNFALGNVLKYLFRSPRKVPTLQGRLDDLQKAKDYLEDEIRAVQEQIQQEYDQ